MDQAGIGASAPLGLVSVTSLKDMQDAERKEAEAKNNDPVLQGLAGHVRQAWTRAQWAKRNTVEPRMLRALRARRGEYEADKLSAIKQMGGSEIYMMLLANKCRSAAAWLRDAMFASGETKPWTIAPTAVPDLSPDEVNEAVERAAKEALALEQQAGQQFFTPERMKVFAEAIRDKAIAEVADEAREKMDKMEDKMEDQLQEGRFYEALHQFIDDLVTFPTAIMAGPIVRRRKTLKWVPGADGTYTPDIKEDLVYEWERLDPFMVYPAANASSVNDSDLIVRHKLSRHDINQLIGVEGYNDAMLREVLDEYGRGGLNEWLPVDIQKASAEGKDTFSAVSANLPNPTIDALQFWGSVQGKMLVEWGVPREQIPDETDEYDAEVWLIGRWVVKATINPDPLGRRPFYAASFEVIPGVFWGNSIYDLISDCCDMCNAAARALANNMGIASGPQVVANTDRLAAGASVTALYPWKVWQVKSDPYGNNTEKPIDFFMPQANVQALMSVYQQFAGMADEYSGIPKYMTGDSATGGAGRTASGMQMLMSNAGKTIKQVLTNIDFFVLQPLLERLYYYNMRYGTDPELKGDIRVVARGAAQLAVKEQIQTRRNEFLQIVMSNPQITQIVGTEPIIKLLRTIAQGLDMPVEDLIPSDEMIRAKEVTAEIMQQVQQMQQQAAQTQEATQQVSAGAPPPKGPTQPPVQLMTGAPGAQPVNNMAPVA